jgi:DNA segregation ATPase FtsK/SpoIIIE-like protein
MPSSTESDLRATQAFVNEIKRRLKLTDDKLRQEPALIYIMDEYADTVQEMEYAERKALTSLLSTALRLGRQAKCHILLGTQEAGKAEMFLSLNNFQTKIAYRCSDWNNSRLILGKKGAENLPIGAKLFKSPQQPTPIYLQGAMMEENEIKQLVEQIIASSHDLSKKFVITDEDLSQLTITW